MLAGKTQALIWARAERYESVLSITEYWFAITFAGGMGEEIILPVILTILTGVNPKESRSKLSAATHNVFTG